MHGPPVYLTPDDAKYLNKYARDNAKSMKSVVQDLIRLHRGLREELGKEASVLKIMKLDGSIVTAFIP